MRVVFLGHTAQPSGAELSLVDLLPVLDEVDSHVILAADGPVVGRLERAGVSVEVLPLAERSRNLQRRLVRPGGAAVVAGLAAAAYSARLGRRLRRLRADLVHANTLKAFLYGIPAARLTAAPLVWHVHDRIDEDYLPRGAVRLLRALGRRRPSGVIANSEATLATLQPLTVPTAVVCEPVGIPDRVWREDRPASRPFTVGIVGRVAPWKGQDVFLRAFAEAFPDGRERAVVVGAPLFGEQEYDDGLRLLVERLGLVGRVELRGFRDDVAAELADLDALVHASTIPEPFGRVIVEGMASGLPVVAAGSGGPTEIITHAVDGLLYPPGDVGALAEILARLSRDRALRVELGTAARGRALDYRPELAADQVAALYRRVLAAGERLAA
jgi:glycosyltransferase involved in cell wall biosynthesis